MRSQMGTRKGIGHLYAARVAQGALSKQQDVWSRATSQATYRGEYKRDLLCVVLPKMYWELTEKEEMLEFMAAIVFV